VKLAQVVAVLLLGVYIAASFVITDARDFAAFYWSGWCVAQGQMESLYDNAATNATLGHWFVDSVPHYIYMPPFAYLMVPLSLLPFRVAMAAWLLLRAGLLAVVVVCITRHLGYSKQDAWVALAMTFMAGPVAYGHSWGQSNALLLVLVVGAIALATNCRDGWAGVLWACALMMKPIAGVLVLAFYRRPRLLAGATGAFLVSILVIGVRPWLDYCHALAKPISDNLSNAPWNASVFGYLYQCPIVYAGIVVAGTALTLYALYHTQSLWQRAALALGFGLAFFPAVEVHHLVLAIVPLMIARRSAPWYAALIALLLTPYLSFQWLPWLGVVGTAALWWCLVNPGLAMRRFWATHPPIAHGE